MKVLQVINSLATGGAEKLLLDTIPLYRKAEIEMDILLLWDNNHPFTIVLKELDCCKVIILNQSDNYKDIYAISNIFKLRNYLKAYDVAHVHLFPSLYFVRLAALGVPIQLIFTEHNTQNKRSNNANFRVIERYCYRGYSKIVCISNEIKSLYTNYLQMPEKTVVIENGVNLENIVAALPYAKSEILKNHDPAAVLLLQVSGFRPQKDQDTLIRSLLFLPPNYKVLLVGDGERKADVKVLVNSLGVEDRVVFLGVRMDVASLLKTVDLVVLSSHYEGLSLASVEGMASGKPFIASDVPGLREVVKGAGILFEQGNEKELAAKIQELSDDPILYDKVASACQARAQQFDISLMVQKHIYLYGELYNTILNN